MTNQAVGRAVDRETSLALAQLSSYCWLLYAIGPLTLLLRTEQNWSRAVAGFHATAMAVGFIVAGATTPRLRGKLGEVAIRKMCMVAVALAITGFASSQRAWMSLLSAFLGGLAGATLVNVLNPALIRRHGQRADSVLSLVNASGATVGSAAPVMIGAAAASRFGWRGLLYAVSIIALTTARGARPTTDVSSAIEPQESEAHGAQGSKKNFRAVSVALYGGLVVEFTTSVFAADVLSSQTGLSTGDAARFSSAFIIGFALSRWLATWLVRAYAPTRVMLTGYGFSICGLLLVGFTHESTIMTLGLFLAGLGIGPNYPLMVTMAIRCAVVDSYRASARIGFVSGIIIAIAPFGLGAMSDKIGLSLLFLTLCGTAAVSAMSLVRVVVYPSNR